jgi:hypothetical protein
VTTVEVIVILLMTVIVIVNCVSVRANVEYIRNIQYGVKLFVALYTQHVKIYKYQMCYRGNQKLINKCTSDLMTIS